MAIKIQNTDMCMPSSKGPACGRPQTKNAKRHKQSAVPHRARLPRVLYHGRQGIRNNRLNWVGVLGRDPNGGDELVVLFVDVLVWAVANVGRWNELAMLRTLHMQTSLVVWHLQILRWCSRR